MQTHSFQPQETRTRPAGRVAFATAATPVGTFAEGQADHGSFRMVAEAELGTFASGLADDPRSERETA
jgi:hypothetical protein